MIQALGVRRYLVDAIAVLSLILLMAGNVMTMAAEPEDALVKLVGGTAIVSGFGGVGWLLWRRVPHNPIGWCFSSAGLAAAVGYAAHGWVVLALASGDTPGAFTRACALVDTYSWIFVVPLAVPLPLLLLPDGRLLSPRWRPVPFIVLGGAALGTLGLFTLPGPIKEPYRQLVNPFGLAALGPLPEVLGFVGFFTLFTGVVVGIVSLVRRFRRSRGVERQQLRWVAAGGCCAFVGSLVFGPSSQDPGLRGLVAGLASAVSLSGLPVCVGVAVLRYRLYDLGRLVSRTLSYALVTASLVGVYLVLVTSLARLLPDSSSLAVAASTLAVAALFQPLRRRVQTGVDRRFNRARYDADRTIESFTRRLRDEVDLDDVRTDLLHVVGDALQPATVNLWLREVRQ